MASTTRRAAAVIESLLGVSRAVASGLAAALSDHSAGVDQWRVLRSLTDSGCTMGDLTKLLEIPPASLTRIVDSLATEALVYRRPDPDDRRLVVIHLSAIGRQKLTQLEGAAEAYLATVRTRLSPAAFDQLDASLSAAHALL